VVVTTMVAGGAALLGGSELSGGNVEPVGWVGAVVLAGMGAHPAAIATVPASTAAATTTLRTIHLRLGGCDRAAIEPKIDGRGAAGHSPTGAPGRRTGAAQAGGGGGGAGRWASSWPIWALSCATSSGTWP
jgi:hypothetical protein